MYPLKNLEKKNTSFGLAKQILIEQFTSLRIIYYLFIPGMFIPALHISANSSMILMDNLPLLIIGTVALIAFIEREKLKTQKFWSWIHLVFTISLGVITVEFIGLSVHSIASITYEAGYLTPEGEFWLHIATIYTGVGGVLFSIVNFYGERIGKKICQYVEPKIAVLGSASFAIIVGIISLWMNPKTHEFFGYLAQLLH